VRRGKAGKVGKQRKLKSATEMNCPLTGAVAVAVARAQAEPELCPIPMLINGHFGISLDSPKVAMTFSQ